MTQKKKRMTIVFAAGAVVIAVLAVLFLPRINRAHRVEFRRSFPIMGTVAQFTFYLHPDDGEKVFDAVRKEFGKVMLIANLYDPDSELARLNKSAADAPFKCSDELWEILSAARTAYKLSGGAFDISAKPLMDLWGFYRKTYPDSLPDEKERAATMEKVGLDKVIFDDAAQTVQFSRQGMALDLGGLAKGYAVDRAAETMKKEGVLCGVIDLGGNLYLGEPPPGQEFYTVGIRDAGNREQLGPVVLKLKNCAVSTSGDYERFVVINGKRYGHIMDPANGLPAHQDFSVTVTASSALQADYLSTTYYLRPSLQQNLPDVNIYIQ